MQWWRNAAPSADAQDLPLSPEEGFVLSRLDQPMTAQALVELTGLSSDRIGYILALLSDKGLVLSDTPSVRPAEQTIPDVEYQEGGPTSAAAPLLEAHAAFANPSANDDTRAAARDWLRARFDDAPGEVKAEVIWSTEGQVLSALDGLRLDARATSILCARTFTSPALVQNLTRLSSCPSQLLVHMLKQQLVKRSPQLRRGIMLHGNLPTDVRRRG